MSRPRRSWPQRAVLTLNVVLIVCCLALAALFRTSFDRAEAINRYELSGALTPVGDDGGGRALNVLLVGSDSASGLDPDDPVVRDRQGERNGDVIIVAHLDERSDTAALLSFPRDLWLPIAGTGSNAKINAAFKVGGAETLIETIEERFDLPIHHYVQVDFAGFQGLVEAVGSVPVYFDAPARDYNAVDGITQTGFEVLEPGCLELGPEQALAYVRSRYYQTRAEGGRWVTDPRADLGRIQRQQDFLRRLMTRAVDQGARNPFTLRQLIDVGLERVTIDQGLTPQDLLDLGRRFSRFDPGQLKTYTVPVEFGTAGTASVLYAQEDPLEPILELFRGAEVSDPSTIRIQLVHQGVDRSRVTATRQGLEDAGYEVAGAAAGEAGPGVTVRFPPGAEAAAQRLASRLGPAVVAVADPALEARDVVVALGPDPVATSTVPGGSATSTVPGGSATSTVPGGSATSVDGPAAPPVEDPAATCR